MWTTVKVTKSDKVAFLESDCGVQTGILMASLLSPSLELCKTVYGNVINF